MILMEFHFRMHGNFGDVTKYFPFVFLRVHMFANGVILNSMTLLICCEDARY